MNRRMQAQEGTLQPTGQLRVKQPEGTEARFFPRAQGPQRRPKGGQDNGVLQTVPACLSLEEQQIPGGVSLWKTRRLLVHHPRADAGGMGACRSPCVQGTPTPRCL